VSVGGSSDRSARIASVLRGVRCFAAAGPDLGLLSHGWFRDLRGAEQAFLFSGRL